MIILPQAHIALKTSQDRTAWEVFLVAEAGLEPTTSGL